MNKRYSRRPPNNNAKFNTNADSIKTWNLNSHGRMAKMPIETERPTGRISFKFRSKIVIVKAPRHMDLLIHHRKL